MDNRTPGDRAFDRCFLPIVSIVVLEMPWAVISAVSPCDEKRLKHVPLYWWESLLPFLVGLGLTILWVRALRSLIEAWNDPSAKVIRFSASACLIVFGLIVIGLLRIPFR